jgi:hypothetical protein
MTPLAWALEALAAVLLAALLVWRFRVRGRVVARRGDVVVRRTRAHVELWLERGRGATLQGRVRAADPRVSGLAYTDGFLLYGLPPAGGAALFVGLGAGVGPRQLDLLSPGVDLVCVEKNPDVAAVAPVHFGVRGQVEMADGRDWEDGRRWDLVVLDAFGAGVFAARTVTVEAFARWRERLRAEGVVVVNLGGTLPRVAPVLAALVAVFGAAQVRVHGVPREDGRPYDARRRGNVLAFGFRGNVPAPRVVVPELLPRMAAIAATVVTPPAAPPLRDADLGPEGELPIV